MSYQLKKKKKNKSFCVLKTLYLNFSTCDYGTVKSKLLTIILYMSIHIYNTYYVCYKECNQQLQLRYEISLYWSFIHSFPVIVCAQ